MNRIILLSKILVLLPFFVPAQNEKKELAAIDTRKGYDLRDYGSDTIYSFAIKYREALPVIIAVSTEDTSFIRETIKLIQKLDAEGFEQLTLILHSLRPDFKKNGGTHSVLFIGNSNIIAALNCIDGAWTFSVTENEKKASGLLLEEKGKNYPIAIIRAEIKNTHLKSGAPRYVTGN